MAKELSKDQIASVLEKAQAQKQRTRGKKHDYSLRTVSNWFTIPHSMGYCTNDKCQSPEEKGGRNRMVADIDGHIMCRICFLDEWHNE